MTVDVGGFVLTLKWGRKGAERGKPKRRELVVIRLCESWNLS